MKVHWYSPGKEEVKCVQILISRYLPPELEKLNQFIEDKIVLSREQLQCSLGIIIAILGCRSMLPLWNEEPVKL